MKHRLFIVLFALSVVACGCGGASQKRGGAAAKSEPSAPQLKHYTYRIVAELPHSTDSYTQGFLYDEGDFVESTGGYGSSVLQRVNPASGEAKSSVALSRNYFGEGLTLLGDKLYQLTWRRGKAFVYDRVSLRKVGEFSYTGEGWGLATDGELLYMSNGSGEIAVRDPRNFEVVRTIPVTIGRSKASSLNELEWIGGELWANVYLTDQILRIDPATGRVVGIIDLSELQSPADRTYNTDVLNGIAYDPATGRIWLTGKNWNKVYQVEIVEK